MRRLIIGIVLMSFAVTGCATSGPNTTTGAILGTVIGGATGAIVGNQLGSTAAGMAIGAGVGGLTGGTIGNAQDKADLGLYESQRRAYAAPAPTVTQEPVAPPPGRWVTVPGQWIDGRWVPAHKVWVPVNP